MEDWMLVIVPRRRAEQHEPLSRQFGDMPRCRVIIDRRVADRRQEECPWPHAERRRSRGRAGKLGGSQGVVVFLR
jgi:hypothetical protein